MAVLQTTSITGNLSTTGVFSASSDINLNRADTTPALVFTAQNGLRWIYSGGGNYWQTTLSVDSGGLLNMNNLPLATRSWVTSQGYVSGSFLPLSGGTMTGNITMNSKIVIQDGTDGGGSRGIWMWTGGDSNWGIYMGTAGASKSLANGTAPTGIDGSNSHHIRFRIAGSSGNGFIWENNSEQALMSLKGDNGNLYTRGQIYAGNSTSNLVLHAGNYSSYAVARYLTTQTGTNPVKIWNGHLASFSTSSSGNTYTIIQTSVPQDNYQMGGFTLEFFNNYSSTNGKTQIDIAGYWNPEGNGGFIGFEYHTSNPFVTPNIQVARNSSTGNVAFIITNNNVSYQVVVARDLWLGYNSSSDSAWGTGWSIYETSSIGGFTNADSVIARVAAGSDGTNASGTWGINITGNSATTSQTNFSTLTLNSATVATQSWVQSQGYLTSGSFLPLSGGTMSGSIAMGGNNITGVNNVSSTNFTVGNAIYFGGGNNYFNWDGARINSNVGIQSGSDMRAPIFYDSQDTGYYLDPNGTSNIYSTYIGRVLINWDGTDTWFRMQSGNRMRITTTGGTDFIIPNTGNMTYNGNTVWHSGNLTNLNQLSNGPGYITSSTLSNYIYTNSGNFTTAGTGWYRVATTGSDGRGTYYVEVYTTGGNHNPSYLKILAHGDWGNDKIVSVETDGGFPANAVRITRGASNTFLEVNFTTQILGAGLRVNRTGFDSAIQIYTGALPAGGDTVWDSVSVYSKGYHTPGAVFAKTRMLVGSTDDNSGKADLSVDTAGSATIALAGQYFRVGGDDINWGVRIQHNGYFRTYGQVLGLTTSAGNYDISFQPNDTQVAYFNTNGLYLSRPLIRTAAGTGYLSGNYASSESTATSGVIYTIGGSYVPNANNLGNMYGIGYTYGAIAGLGANSAWGLYVATNGTTRVFLDADSGIGTATGSWRAPIFYDSADTSYYLDPNSSSNLYSVTMNRAQVTYDVTSSSGQGRFGGWYNGTGYTGLAAELGISAGEAYLISYNRSAGSYGNLRLEASNINIGGSGNTSNVDIITYTNYKMRVTGGDVIQVYNGASTSNIYLNYYGSQVVLNGQANGNTLIGTTSNVGYRLHVAGDIYANGGWVRVSGSSGLYFETYGGGWRMTGSSYVESYNGKSVHMNGGSVDYVGSLYLQNGPGVHLQGNTDGSYGSLQITQSKNSWAGIYFTYSGNTLMMNSNESGHYRQGYGWQYRWYNGTFYISTSGQGGGSEYIALHTGNIGSYALTETNSTFTYAASLTLSTSWQNTGVSNSNLTSNGVYVVSCSLNDFGSGGSQYSETYTGLMYWYASSTNSDNYSEISLHHMGHADNDRYIYLRTKTTPSGNGSFLQIRGNGNNSSAATYNFTFKRLL